MIKNLNWIPTWTSHMGCLKGCLDYLGIEVSLPWLFGGTGHAFIHNIHQELCPSGPTAWMNAPLHRLGANLGYRTEAICSHRGQEGFEAAVETAWQRVRAALDDDFPCIGWEMKIPEFYVICGYDHKGYLFNGPLCDGVEGPHPWKTVGGSEIGALEIYIVKPGETVDPAQAVKAALEFAVAFADSPTELVFPDYRAGSPGYDYWIQALEKGEANGHGNAYNCAVWRECREMAVEFLAEAGERLNGQALVLIEQAAEKYRLVASGLTELAEIFPFELPLENMEEQVKDESRRRQGVEALLPVRAAEAEGLQLLARIAEVL